MVQPLAQPPKNEDRSFNDWMFRLWRRLTSIGGLPWNVVDKTGANITDIPTRHHDDLQYIPSNPVLTFGDAEHEDQMFIPPPNTYDFDHVVFPAKWSLGAMAHVYTLQELMNHEWSAGVVDGAILTDNGNGTISLSAAISVLRASTDPHTTLYGVETPAQLNIALTDNATNYVYLDWNAGNPIFSVSTSVASFNCLDKCLAYVVHRNGTALHAIDAREQNVDGNRKYRQFSLQIERFRHAANGTVLGANGLAITLTAGTFFFMLQQIDHIAFDTSVAGTANANVFALWYRNGLGGWTEVANSKVVDTTTYDNNTGTPVVLGNNKFGVTWFYVINDSPSELHAVMGEVEYANLAAATVATPPVSVPTIIDGLGSLVGFVAYEKGNIAFNAIYSAFTQTFSSSAATTHNGLSGLQGGSVNQYYHLTAAQSQQVNDFISRGAMGIPGFDGEDGQDGMQGPIGLTGATGPQGSIGPAGPQGMIGIGLDGEDGEEAMPIPGPQGPQGATGQGASIQGAYKNLQASSTGISANISVSADEIAVENSSNNYQTLRSVSLTIAGTSVGANGLDAGTIAASTWYSIWVIWNGATTAGLMSTSATAPTLPTGYTHKARVGWIRTDGTANKYPLSFKQLGCRIQYAVVSGSNVANLPIMASGVQGNVSTPTWVAVSTANYIPTTAGYIYIMMRNSSNTSLTAPNNGYGGLGSTTNPPPFAGSGSTMQVNMLCHMLIESSNIYVAGDAAASVWACIGWEDNL